MPNSFSMKTAIWMMDRESKSPLVTRASPGPGMSVMPWSARRNRTWSWILDSILMRSPRGQVEQGEEESEILPSAFPSEIREDGHHGIEEKDPSRREDPRDASG